MPAGGKEQNGGMSDHCAPAPAAAESEVIRAIMLEGSPCLQHGLQQCCAAPAGCDYETGLALSPHI